MLVGDGKTAEAEGESGKDRKRDQRRKKKAGRLAIKSRLGSGDSKGVLMWGIGVLRKYDLLRELLR